MSDPAAILASLSDAALTALATAVDAGWLRGGSPGSAFASIAGENGAAVSAWVKSLENASFTPAQISRLINSIVAGRYRDRILIPDLVIGRK